MKNSKWKSILGWLVVAVFIAAIPMVYATEIGDDITIKGFLKTDVSQDAEYGAGAEGTAFAPRLYRSRVNDFIITTIHVDLTGLKVKGTAQNDVIGLGAGGAAYLARYVTATWGLVYRIEVICLEAPAGSNTTTDIDIAGNSSASLEYDGAAGAAEMDVGGLAVTAIYTDNAPALTANDYIYLVEGDTAASQGTYTAGQLIIKFYGHALLTSTD